jgi:hypothetical protein
MIGDETGGSNDGLTPEPGAHGKDSTPGVFTNLKQTPSSDTFTSEMEARMAEVVKENEIPQELYEKFRGFSERVNEIKSGSNFDDLKEDIKNKLAEGKFPIKQEMLEDWIDQIHPELNDEDKKDLKEKLLGLAKPMTDDEKIVPNDPEAAAMEEKKNEILTEADTAYKEDLKAIAADTDLDEAAKGAANARAATMLGKIQGLFAPGEAGRVWTKRLGKGLGYTALAIAIALLAYLKAIHSMARRK